MKFGDLVGNQTLVNLLRRSQRFPPASLFSGPSGVGKKSVALLLAGLANCHSPQEQDLCLSCTSCLKLSGGNHPDITLVDEGWLQRFADTQKRKYNPQVIPIDASRALVREAQYRPFQDRLRFFIIDEAEKMNEAAANALLKTLEEPAETTRFILISAYPDRLLETVRSRCQQFRFASLTRAEIRQCLEKEGVENPELRARFAGGSIGHARSLDLESRIQDRDLMLKLLTRWLERPSFARIYRACESAPLKTDLKDRQRALALLDALQELCQDLYYLQTGQEERLVNRDRVRELRESSLVALERLRSFHYHIEEARWDIRHYVSPLICFETLWLRSQKDA